jgi:hypothetical protein
MDVPKLRILLRDNTYTGNTKPTALGKPGELLLLQSIGSTPGGFKIRAHDHSKTKGG